MAFSTAYDKLASKHKLPSFDELSKEIDLSGIESEENPIGQVRNRISERLDLWIELLESVLWPDQGSSAAMYEARVVTEEMHKDIFGLFKRVMIVARTLDEATVLTDEKADVEAIKTAWKEWQSLKKGVVDVVRLLKDSWQKKVHHENHVGYLG